MIALFPARMNPPHLGHIITLLNIKNDYDKIIVALTDDDFDGAKPTVISTDKKIFTLNEVLKHFPKYEIVTYEEPFRTRKTFDDLPKFDVVITGSKKVYDAVVKHGLKARLIERTPVYRGTHIREAYQKGLKESAFGFE